MTETASSISDGMFDGEVGCQILIPGDENQSLVCADCGNDWEESDLYGCDHAGCGKIVCSKCI